MYEIIYVSVFMVFTFITFWEYELVFGGWNLGNIYKNLQSVHILHFKPVSTLLSEQWTSA